MPATAPATSRKCFSAPVTQRITTYTAQHNGKGRPPGTVEFGFSTGGRLEDVSARLTDDGYERTFVDEGFGRSIRVTYPDGVVIQIHEIDPATMPVLVTAVRGTQSRILGSRAEATALTSNLSRLAGIAVIALRGNRKHAQAT